MKRLLPLILLLLPLLIKAQTIIVGGPVVSPITLASNQTYHDVTIDGGNANVNLVTGNGVSNVHIHKLLLRNTTGFAILLNNCHNIEIDSTFITNVGFGIYAQSGSTIINVHDNQFLNINGISTTSLGHAVQFNAVNGGGNRINHNIVENTKNITDQTSHPHDQLSLFQCNGIVGDSIQVNYNWIRGGQLTAYPTSGSTGDGIGLGDVGGNYQVARGNIEVNPGCAGIQVISNGSPSGSTGIKLEGNIIYSKQTPVSTNGINVQNSIQQNVSSNRTNWTNFRGNNVLLADGETQYDYFGGPTPIGQSTNHWQDATVTPNILPAVIITMAAAPVGAPNISYTPSNNTYTAGTTIGVLTPSNSGGVVTSSYSVSPALPAGLSLNTSTGSIVGTPTTTTPTTIYVVSASNSAGASHFNLTVTVKSTPVAIPVIKYNPSTNVYTINQTIPTLSPISTGGTVVSYAIDKTLPTGLSFNTTNGQISGTVTVLTPATVYTITATNASGSAKATVSISVIGSPIQAPIISYNPNTINATYGIPIAPLGASNTGGAGTFTVSPGLPFGFVLDPNLGTITALPGATHSSSSFTVTCTNSAGSSNATVIISVVAAPLVITCVSQTKYVNTANPVLTVVYSGFLGTDSPATGLTTLPNISTTASLGSPIGSYPITASGAASNLYSISYAGGILEVVNANVTTITFHVISGVINP